MKLRKYAGLGFSLMFTAVLFACGGSGSSSSLSNPAAAYCEKAGYQYILADDSCALANGIACDVWDFYRGSCGQSYTYCEKHNGVIQNVTEKSGTATYEYALCTFSDNSVCLEDDYINGKCKPGQCSSYSIEKGCIR
jgi:putative hemolysin